MAVYTAYYDASGQQEQRDRQLVVAGLLSTEVKWRRFEREWEEVLRRFRVPYSHMREFAHNRGAFNRGWRGLEDKRADFLGALVQVLRHVKVVRLTRVLPADFATVDREYDLMTPLGGAYPLAAGHCVLRMEAIRLRTYRQHAIEHVVEKGDSAQGTFRGIMQVAAGIDPIIKPHHDERTGRYIREFEAADLFAYEYGLASQRVLEGSDQKLRASFKALRKRVPQRSFGHTIESMRAMCVAAPNIFTRRT